MSFFYDLNKRLAALATKQEQQQIAESKQAEAVAQSPLTQALNESDYSAKKARAGKDIGKPGKTFAKIAKSAGERYGSKAAGERVAGAVLNKLRHPKESVEEADVLGQFEDEMTPKQKAFAKLAPPKDKITFADKIAGAKKEVDEMLGDVAAEAMKAAIGKGRQQVADEGNAFTGALAKTPKGGKFKVGNKEFTDTSSIEEDEEEMAMDEGYAEMDAWLKSREKEKGTGRFDKRKVSTGTVYTRKPETFDADDEETSDAPKKKGRPAGTKRAIGAKVKGTSKLHRKDAIAEEEHEVCSECGQPIVYEKAPPGAKAERMVKHIKKSLSKDGKLSDKDKAIAYATTWKAHTAGKVEEESTEKEDQKAEKAGRKVAKDIEHDEGHKAKGDNKAEKAGNKVTKDIEYDDKKDRKEKKEEKVDETTTSGSVATASAAPKSSKGMQFGKGVYESLDKQFKQALTESIQVQETVAECGTPGLAPELGITVQANGEDAVKLMQLLKLAGLASGETCPGCGHSPCDCDAEIVDENSPDWPTNTETKEADPQLRTYSGGLNGPKSSGQSTTIGGGLPNLDPRRQASMEESVKLEKTLSDLYKNYKG